MHHTTRERRHNKLHRHTDDGKRGGILYLDASVGVVITLGVARQHNDGPEGFPAQYPRTPRTIPCHASSHNTHVRPLAPRPVYIPCVNGTHNASKQGGHHFVLDAVIRGGADEVLVLDVHKPLGGFYELHHGVVDGFLDTNARGPR